MEPRGTGPDDSEGRGGACPETTAELVARARAGETAALDRICERYMAPLRRWATGRLPRQSRGMLDTDDIVQDTIIRTLRQLDRFEPQGEGALGGYLRQALLNRIRDQVRRVRARPDTTGIDGREIEAPAASPLDQAIGVETVERYEAALARLRAEDREAVIVRLELDLSYAEAAQALGKPSADAARMAISRALVRLAREMSHDAS